MSGPARPWLAGRTGPGEFGPGWLVIADQAGKSWLQYNVDIFLGVFFSQETEFPGYEVKKNKNSLGYRGREIWVDAQLIFPIVLLSSSPNTVTFLRQRLK